MKSHKRFKDNTIFSVKIKKTGLRFFFIVCCLVVCPNFALLAEQNALEESEATKFIPPLNPRTKIYFYNPEINTARNLVLKNAWDRYLYEAGAFEFQPVEDSNDFVKLVHSEQNSAFIMAEWFYSTFVSQEKQLELGLQGLVNGQDTYQKILVSNNQPFDFEKVTIACSGSTDRALEVLGSIYPELAPQQLGQIKLLLVPKDIDALMAVGYGLADMALTTPSILTKMVLINESLIKDMTVIKESKPLKRSVLVFKSSNLSLKIKLAKALMNMPTTLSGQQAMTLLGLDEWQLSKAMSEILPESFMDNTNKNGSHNNDK